MLDCKNIWQRERERERERGNIKYIKINKYQWKNGKDMKTIIVHRGENFGKNSLIKNIKEDQGKMFNKIQRVFILPILWM